MDEELRAIRRARPAAWPPACGGRRAELTLAAAYALGGPPAALEPAAATEKKQRKEREMRS